MAFLPLSAKNASVRIGTFVLYAKSWSVTPKTDKLDVTSFESGGFGSYIGGIIDCDISIDELEWNGAAGGSIYDNPPNIQPTQIIAMTLYTNGVGSPAWVFSTVLIVDAGMTAKVRETIKISKITAASCGSFTYPTN